MGAIRYDDMILVSCDNSNLLETKVSSFHDKAMNIAFFAPVFGKGRSNILLRRILHVRDCIDLQHSLMPSLVGEEVVGRVFM